MSYDYISNNIKSGIDERNAFSIAVAHAQAALEQLFVLKRIAYCLETIADIQSAPLRAQKDAERDAERDAVRELPIFQYLVKLPLSTRLHNLIIREMCLGRWPELCALSVEGLHVELDKPNGGLLFDLCNLGKVGIEEIRSAVLTAERARKGE